MIRKIMLKLRKLGLTKTIKIMHDQLVRPFIPIYYQIKWDLLSKRIGFSGVTNLKRKQELIVSLTTFPARIEIICVVIKTLLMQTTKPDRIILWLAEEQFSNKSLPDSLMALEKYGLTISWCKDIKSYKKLIPALEMYPNATIITADDDMYYHSKMVERLYKSYLKDPSVIHCHRVTKFYIENDEFKTVAGGYDIYSHPSYLHKLTGCSGTCYPPHSLHPDICKEELFMKLTPTNDDIWFWLMAAMNGMKCNVVKHSCTALYFVKGSQEEALNLINDKGEKLFWKQFQNMLRYYPEIKILLKQEWEQERNENKR